MNSGFSSPPFPGSPERLAVRTNFMPDWIGDQMAGVRPDATRVFGRVDRGWAPRSMIPVWGSDLPTRRQLKNRAPVSSRAHCVVIQQYIGG
jgi:hypothetical protein